VRKTPKGWVDTTLREISLAVETIRPDEFPDKEFVYFDIQGIDNETNRVVETKTFFGWNAPSRARQVVQKDDILFSTVRTYLKKVALVDRELPNAVASTGFAVIRVPSPISPHFIFFQILSDDFIHKLNRLQTGTSYPSVRSKDVFAQSILIAPRAEQDRIVERLKESRLHFTNSARVARRALTRIDHYRAALLHAAVTGELTRKWRSTHEANRTGHLLQHVLSARRTGWEQAELLKQRKAKQKPKDDTWKSRYPEPAPFRTEKLPKLPNGWIWASLDQLSLVVRGSSPRPAGDPRYFGGRIPWITVHSITKDSEPYLTEVSETLTRAGKERSRFVEKGTLLLSNSGVTLGVPKITLLSGCINDGVAALLYLDSRLTTYLYYFLSSQTQHLRRINQGAAQPNLNTEIIRRIAVPVPPFAEQSQISREVGKRLAAAQKLSGTLARQVHQSELAFQSVLSQAFTGQLVAQYPADSAASSVLDKIRVLKETTYKKTRTKRMTSSKSKAARKPLLEVLRVQKKPITPEQLFVEAGFRPAEAELFYRELASLRKMIEESKPSGVAAKRWPFRAKVLLQLKESSR
jgi:type I restriction enzyme S subunit